MFYVPLYVELLRARPAWVFWTATLVQAAIWLVVPTLFYTAPPGELAELLAIGHEFRFDAGVGPPLAYWLAECAFRLGHLFGVYALSQLCVVATYACVFALGRMIVGATHAALAALLMVGISLYTVPSPNFGPPLLATAVWATALLYYWRAVALGEARAWYRLGCALALLLLTSSAALILIGILALLTVTTERGRAALDRPGPWIVIIALAGFVFLHLIWLQGASAGLAPVLERLRDTEASSGNTVLWLQLLGALLLAHAGAVILLVLAAGWPRVRAGPAPPLAREAVEAFGVTFARTVALLPALTATAAAVLIGQHLPIGGAAPLVLLSGLALVVIAGDTIELYHQRVLGFAWAGLLIVPPLFVPFVIALLPWTIGADLQVAQPAGAMGRFFAESFERRTGEPLAIVTGEPRLAALIAVAAPSRPSVFFDADPGRSPWVTADDIRKHGAIVVWTAADTTPVPPPEIRAYFPDLVAELPRTFERAVEGRLPVLRIGWGVIRPGSVEPAP